MTFAPPPPPGPSRRAVDLSDVPEPGNWFTRAISRLFGKLRKQHEQAQIAQQINGGRQLAYGRTTVPPVSRSPVINVQINNNDIDAEDTMRRVSRAMARAAVSTQQLSMATRNLYRHSGGVPPTVADAQDFLDNLEVEREVRKAIDMSEPTKATSKRKVWFDDDRPSVVAARLKEEARLKVMAEREAEAAARRQAMEAEAAKRRTVELKKAEALLEEQRARLAGREDGRLSSSLLRAIHNDDRVVTLNDLFPTKATASFVERIESYHEPISRKDVFRTYGEIGPPPEGYSYYLVGLDVEPIRHDPSRPDRANITLLFPEVRRIPRLYDHNMADPNQRRAIPVNQVLPMPIEATLSLRLQLPKDLADMVGALVLMKDEGREDLRSYRVSHVVLNNVLEGHSLYAWTDSAGRLFSVFGARAVFGEYEAVVRGARHN